MPIYEYTCQKCGNVVELMQKISDPPPRKCERCGGKLVRVISQTSFRLEGGGWYKDLYSSSTPKATAKKGREKAESAVNSEGKTETAKPASTKK